MTKQTAAEATASATAEAVALAERIIAKLQSDASRDSLHWGWAGNASHAKNELAELARFLNA